MSEYGTALDPELMNEAMKRAEDECIDLYDALLPRNVAPDGMTYGSEPMNRGDRIGAFLFRVQSGALDILETASPEVFKRYVEEFIDDVSKTPEFSTSPRMVALRNELSRRIEVM